MFVVWLIGTWAQERRRYIGTVEERAARAEREREQRAALAVAEERERIARELHDVVTHHVSVIVIQAGAALRALDRRPADARAALEAIDGSARAALTDMRRMLGILGPGAGPARQDGAGAVTADEALAPMPGLDRLGELLEQVRAAGRRSSCGRGRAPCRSIRARAVRLPDRPGGADQHAQARPGGHVRGDAPLPAGRARIEVVDDGGRGRSAGGPRVSSRADSAAA